MIQLDREVPPCGLILNGGAQAGRQAMSRLEKAREKAAFQVSSSERSPLLIDVCCIL